MFRAMSLLVLMAVVVGFRFLPWQWKLGIVAGIVLLLALAWLLGANLLVMLFMIPFRLKGAVLKRARLAVHSIEPVPPPEPVKNEDLTPDEKPADPGPPRLHYVVEATITPGFALTPFSHWELGDLQLVRPSYKPLGSESDDSCVILQSSYERAKPAPVEGGPPGRDEDDDYGDKVVGSHRVRMLVGVLPGIDRLTCAYYFSKFGEVVFPPHPSPPAAAQATQTSGAGVEAIPEPLVAGTSPAQHPAGE